MRKYGLPPVFDARTKALILGAFPSEKALASQQYYGNPQNHFWRLMGAVLAEDLPSMEYEHRLQTLLKHRIGLWDVFASCEREGSMDKDIRNPIVNEFAKLPAVQRVYFNGKKAYSQAHKFKEHWDIPTYVLPSSSPASFMPFDEKLKQWRIVVQDTAR